ncbi:MAG: hypothetical protein ACOYN0_14910 [Phycisphaerales bacterium]
MNRQYVQLVALVLLLVQGAVALLGGPGSKACLGCLEAIAATPAIDEGDEQGCCCSGGACACCGTHDAQPKAPKPNDDGKCPSLVAVPAMSADTLRAGVAVDVSVALLPPGLVPPVLREAAALTAFGVPPPDPDPGPDSPRLDCTVLVI